MYQIVLFIFLICSLLGQMAKGDTGLFPIKSEDIVGVEILIVDASDNSLESNFGHSLIRFITKSPDPLSDIVFSFEAEIPGAPISFGQYLWRGVTGQFNSIIRRVSLMDVMIVYFSAGNRGFSQLPLRLSRAQIENLVSTANKVSSGELTLDKYTFFDFNCARALGWFVEASHIPLLGKAPLIPTQLFSYFYESLLAPWSSIEIISGAKVLKKVRVFEYGDGTIYVSQTDLKKLSLREIYILSTSNYNFNKMTKTSLAQLLQNFDMDLLDIYRLRRLPIHYYSSEATPTLLTRRQIAEIDQNLVTPYLYMEARTFYFDDPHSLRPAEKDVQKIKKDLRNQDLILFLNEKNKKENL